MFNLMNKNYLKIGDRRLEAHGLTGVEYLLEHLIDLGSVDFNEINKLFPNWNHPEWGLILRVEGDCGDAFVKDTSDWAVMGYVAT